MNETLKALQQPEYVHVLINHLPLTGLIAATLTLIMALITKSRTSIVIGLFLVALFAGSAWPVISYGEKGYDRVLAMADEDGVAYLKHHMELGNRWSKLYYGTALVALIGVWITWKLPRYSSVTALIVVILSIVSLIAGADIAEAGGKIRHREFRTGSPPVILESEHKHHHEH